MSPLWGWVATILDDASTRDAQPLIELSLRTGEEVYGKRGYVEPLAGGSTPVYAFAQPLGNIAAICPGVGYWDNRTHSPDEHIRIKDFLNAARHIARIVEGFAELESNEQRAMSNE